MRSSYFVHPLVITCSHLKRERGYRWVLCLCVFVAPHLPSHRYSILRLTGRPDPPFFIQPQSELFPFRVPNRIQHNLEFLGFSVLSPPAAAHESLFVFLQIFGLTAFFAATAASCLFAESQSDTLGTPKYSVQQPQQRWVRSHPPLSRQLRLPGEAISCSRIVNI